MALDLRTLKCNQCGSTALQQIGPIHFQCTHCRATTLVDHRPTMQGPAVRPPTPMPVPMPLPARAPAATALPALLAAGGTLLAVSLAVGVIGAVVGRSKGAGQTGAGGSAWSRSTAKIDLKTLTTEARAVVSGRGSSASPKVLVTVRNDGKTPVEGVDLQVAFFDGAKPAGTGRTSVSSFELMPGELHAMVVDLPKDGGDRQTVTVLSADPLDAAVEGPALQCARARLVQRGERVRFVCGPHNGQGQALSDVRAFVAAYDASKALVGFGEWSNGGDIAPASDGLIAGDLTLVSTKPIASWDYRLRYELPVRGASKAPVVGPDRTVHQTGAPESFPEKLELDDASLVASKEQAFDTDSLRVAEWQVGHDNIQNSVLLSEIKNPTSDVVVLGIQGLVTPYDKEKAGTPSSIGALSLYPGESFPVRVVPRGLERMNRTVVRWAPSRRAALPGPRVPLEIAIASTKASTGSVLVNFSQRYTYKAVEVKGTIKNLGKKVVAKPIVWVMLRDKSDRLAGFERIEGKAVAPGESVPFETRIVEEGSAWTRVTTTYQTGE